MATSEAVMTVRVDINSREMQEWLYWAWESGWRAGLNEEGFAYDSPRGMNPFADDVD